MKSPAQNMHWEVVAIALGLGIAAIIAGIAYWIGVQSTSLATQQAAIKVCASALIAGGTVALVAALWILSGPSCLSLRKGREVTVY